AAGNLATDSSAPCADAVGLWPDDHQPLLGTCPSLLDQVLDRRCHRQAPFPHALPAGRDCASGHAGPRPDVVCTYADALQSSTKAHRRTAPPRPGTCRAVVRLLLR